MLIRYPDILRLTRTRHFERGQLAERLLTKRRWNKLECCCLWRQNLRHDLCLTLWLGCESHVITNWTEVRRRAFETKTKAANAFTIFGSFVSRAQSLGVLQLMNGRVYCECILRESLPWGERYFNIMPKYTGSNFFCGHCQQIVGKSTFYKHKKRFYNFSSRTWKMAATTYSKTPDRTRNYSSSFLFQEEGPNDDDFAESDLSKHHGTSTLFNSKEWRLKLSHALIFLCFNQRPFLLSLG